MTFENGVISALRHFEQELLKAFFRLLGEQGHADLKVGVAQLQTEIKGAKTELIYWLIGIVGLGALISHFWPH